VNTNPKFDRALALALNKEGKARLEYQDRIKKAWERADTDLCRRERGLPEIYEAKQ
jgi:hypothetical protein